MSDYQYSCTYKAYKGQLCCSAEDIQFQSSSCVFVFAWPLVSKIRTGTEYVKGNPVPTVNIKARDNKLGKWMRHTFFNFTHETEDVLATLERVRAACVLRHEQQQQQQGVNKQKQVDQAGAGSKALAASGIARSSALGTGAPGVPRGGAGSGVGASATGVSAALATGGKGHGSSSNQQGVAGNSSARSGAALAPSAIAGQSNQQQQVHGTQSVLLQLQQQYPHLDPAITGLRADGPLQRFLAAALVTGKRDGGKREETEQDEAESSGGLWWRDSGIVRASASDSASQSSSSAASPPPPTTSCCSSSRALVLLRRVLGVTAILGALFFIAMVVVWLFFGSAVMFGGHQSSFLQEEAVSLDALLTQQLQRQEAYGHDALADAKEGGESTEEGESHFGSYQHSASSHDPDAILAAHMLRRWPTSFVRAHERLIGHLWWHCLTFGVCALLLILSWASAATSPSPPQQDSTLIDNALVAEDPLVLPPARGDAGVVG